MEPYVLHVYWRLIVWFFVLIRSIIWLCDFMNVMDILIFERVRVIYITWYLKAKLRSSSWWIRFFVQTSLEEDEGSAKKFEQAASKQSYKPGCQVFHLNSYHWYREITSYEIIFLPPFCLLFFSVLCYKQTQEKLGRWICFVLFCFLYGRLGERFWHIIVNHRRF